METPKIEKGKPFTTVQLINDGWKHSCGFGNCQIWKKGDEGMLYEPKEGIVKEIFSGFTQPTVDINKVSGGMM